MININEIFNKMAVLMARDCKFMLEHYKNEENEAYTTDSIGKLSPEDQEKYNEIKHELNRYRDEVGAIPEMFDILEPWMVDVHGNSDINPESIIKSLNNESDVENFDVVLEKTTTDKLLDGIAQTGGLQKSVIDFVKLHGFKITDSGGGCGGWHIGVPCNESTARRLCTMIYTQFSKAIKAGLLRVDRHFWRWKLPGLANGQDAINYCEEHGLSIEEE
jgi:hypothetical protein